MGSFQIARPTVEPIQQPDVLGNFQRLQALKSAAQQQQYAAQEEPMRQQIMQQTAQTGAVDLQEKQQAIKDQQAATSAFDSWDGKSYEELARGIVKNGGSYGAAQSVIAAGLKQKADASKLQGEALDQQIKKNALIAPVLASVDQIPDEQLPQAIVSKAQELAQQGLFDPQHVQIAQQLAASGDPAKIRQGVAGMLKGVTAFSQILDQQKETETERHNKAMELKVPVDQQEMNDWLRKNPGKGASDFLAWKAKQSPTGVILGNQLSGAGNNDALDFAANNYRMTGQMPSGLARSPGTTTAIINRAAQLDQEQGGSGIATNKTVLNANKTSLANLQKNFDQVSAFESTATKNLDLFLDKLNQIPDLGAKFANVPMRMINDKMIGTANYQAMKAAQQTAAAETAKVLSSANASGVLSDTQKKEAEDMLSGNLSYAAAQKVVQTLKQDFANRHQSYQQQIVDIKGRLSTAGGAGSTQDNQPQGGGNDPFAQFGGKAH